MANSLPFKKDMITDLESPPSNTLWYPSNKKTHGKSSLPDSSEPIGSGIVPPLAVLLAELGLLLRDLKYSDGLINESPSL